MKLRPSQEQHLWNHRESRVSLPMGWQQKICYRKFQKVTTLRNAGRTQVTQSGFGGALEEYWHSIQVRLKVSCWLESWEAGGSLRNVSSHIFRWWHHQKVGSPLQERGSHPGGLPSVEVSHEASGRCGAFPVARILPGLQQHLPIPISPISDWKSLINLRNNIIT